MNKVVYYLLFASLIFTSCKREFILFRGGNEKFSVDEFHFDYLASKAKFNYTNGKNKFSAIANFRIKKDSLIWISISPGLGIEAARVLISRDKIQMIDKIKKNYYEFDYLTLTETYGVDMNYDLVEAIVLGNMLFPPERRQDITKDENQFSFTKINDIYGVSHFIGTNSKKLEKLLAFDQVTNNSISVNYDRFEKIEDQIVPQSIHIKIEISDEDKEDTDIKIEYNRVLLYSQPLKFPFHVSSKYKRK